MLYTYIKALHIIFVVSWFAGLFYMPRLFIYHTEANEKEEPAASALKETFHLMEKRLFQIIMNPALVLTLASGIAMLIINPFWLTQLWMQIKLCFVLALLVYHFISFRIYKKLGHERFEWSSTALRIWNELATIILVAVVFLAVVKNGLSWIWAVGALFLLGILLMLGIRLYKLLRKAS